MPTIALLSGAAALIAGLVKYSLDIRSAKKSPPIVSISIGNDSIQVPSSYTPDQVAALVTFLKDKTVTGHATK